MPLPGEYSLSSTWLGFNEGSKILSATSWSADFWEARQEDAQHRTVSHTSQTKKKHINKKRLLAKVGNPSWQFFWNHSCRRRHPTFCFFLVMEMSAIR